MITNIIKDLIKDIPSVANSTIRLAFEDKDNGTFYFITNDEEKVTIAVTNAPKKVTSVEAFKKQLIVDLLYMVATQDNILDCNGKPYTLASLAKTIDDIIKPVVVLWNMKD